MADIQRLINTLKKEMAVAMGCTEPAASALAGARAREILSEEPERINIYASRDMIKNAMGVGIPNCEERGIRVAVCLGICGGDSADGLSILSSVSDEQKRRASAMAKEAGLSLDENGIPVYIRVELTGKGHRAVCEVSGEHDKFTYMEKDGTIICMEEAGTDTDDAAADVLSTAELAALSLSDVVDFADNVPLDQVDFVWEGACINREMAEFSLKEDFGLNSGRVILSDQPEHPADLTGAIIRGAGMAAAASEARMSGCPKPVVINSGSGNQGITCSVPVLAVAEYLGSDRESTTRALCVSQLIGLMMTARKDRLSALCGAFTAAIGAGCAIVYLLGGRDEEMDYTVRNMLGNLTGIVCDGAKQTCALKISSCVEAAGLSARLAMEGRAPDSESGIVGDDFTQCEERMARLTHEGMTETDNVILEIMLEE